MGELIPFPKGGRGRRRLQTPASAAQPALVFDPPPPSSGANPLNEFNVWVSPTVSGTISWDGGKTFLPFGPNSA